METAIEMAREAAGKCFDVRKRKPGAQFGMESAHAERCRNGEGDDYDAVQSALHMHTMRQAEIDAKDADIAELVEALAAAFADPMRLINSESAMNETATLLAKHRPDAFAKWADGVIEGDCE